MLHSLNAIRGYAIRASDGEIGSLRDVYFDDDSTLIRYFVVDTGTWLPGRRVLLAPAVVGGIDSGRGQLVTGLTRQQVEDSPPGVPASELDQLFEPLYRADTARQRVKGASGGSGLGLLAARDALLLAGDQCLILRNEDLLCRYAGDRFALLLPGMGEAEAHALAQHLCVMVAMMRHHGPQGALPVSLRYACEPARGDAENLLARLSRAIGEAGQAAAQAPCGP